MLSFLFRALPTLIFFHLICNTPVSGQAQSPDIPDSTISLPTQIRVHGDGWWPTKGDAAREDFAGSKECTLCHFAKAATYKDAAMSHASVSPLESQALHQHDSLTFKSGEYSYQLRTGDAGSTFAVSDGKSTVSAELKWAFGTGHMGQTYIYKKNNDLYESHLSFYTEPQVLDITPGHADETIKTLDEALGRLMEPSEIKRCFGCHTTASTVNGTFDPEHAFWGVTCESCHGPGAKHVAAMKTGAQNGRELIFNPARLGPVSSVDFCGACHRTWQDVVGNGLIGAGMLNVRFAPYRLENSKCWKQQDARLTCVACHDPHKPLVQDAQSYDEKCLQCHWLRGQPKTANVPGKACPVASKKCVSCHMPKYQPPNLHSTFTDHWIRVVKRGQPYPD